MRKTPDAVNSREGGTEEGREQQGTSTDVEWEGPYVTPLN